MSSTAESYALLPTLPSEVAQKIFENLPMIDVCNAAQASTYFWNITCQLSSLQLDLSLESAASVSATIESFLAFLSSRSMKGMEVTFILKCYDNV